MNLFVRCPGIQLKFFIIEYIYMPILYVRALRPTQNRSFSIFVEGFLIKTFEKYELSLDNRF